jgi:hypothetical protein
LLGVRVLLPGGAELDVVRGWFLLACFSFKYIYFFFFFFFENNFFYLKHSKNTSKTPYLHSKSPKKHLKITSKPPYFIKNPYILRYYPFHYAPFASDFAVLLPEDLDVSFELGRPFLPFNQLMGVFPEASGSAIPTAWVAVATCHFFFFFFFFFLGNFF